MAHDTAARPSELLKLKVKDIVFKHAGESQYAEVSVNGKTGTRHLPLIDSIPYIKDYLQNARKQEIQIFYYLVQKEEEALEMEDH